MCFLFISLRKYKSGFPHPLQELWWRRKEVALGSDGITLFVICVAEILLRWMNTHFAGMESPEPEAVIIQLRLLFKNSIRIVSLFCFGWGEIDKHSPLSSCLVGLCFEWRVQQWCSTTRAGSWLCKTQQLHNCTFSDVLSLNVAHA